MAKQRSGLWLSPQRKSMTMNLSRVRLVLSNDKNQVIAIIAGV